MRWNIMRLGEIKKALEASCQTIPETYKARNCITFLPATVAKFNNIQTTGESTQKGHALVVKIDYSRGKTALCMQGKKV